MQVSRFRSVIYLQLFFLLVDLFVNSFCELFRSNNVVLLVLYAIQDIVLLLALIVLFLVFFTTYVFQAGMIFLLVRKFRSTIIVTVTYLALSVGLHIWTMSRKWGEGIKYIWTDSFQALYVIQRVSAVFYYFMYKRSMMKLADPRYYQDSEWLRKEFARAR